MRAVTGMITSREPATVKQAAKVITKFCKSMDFGGRRDVAAYLSRTSAAVEDLYLFHRGLRKKGKTLEQQKQETSVEIKEKKEAAEVNKEKVEEEKDSKRKKKRSREVKLEIADAVGEIEHGSDKREEEKKKKNKIEE